MVYNYIFQAIVQVAVLTVLLFLGDDILDLDLRLSDPLYPTDTQVLDNLEYGWTELEPTDKVDLFAVLFLTFVFMQVFNYIACMIFSGHASNLLKLAPIMTIIVTTGITFVLV